VPPNVDGGPTRVNPGQSKLPAIPGIELVRELGRGGMAVVFEGLDLNFSPPRRVAVKLMSQELSIDPEFRKRFEREASLVGTFRHDGIVHVYACGEVQGAKYIVMEYLPGGTLGDLLAQGPLSAPQAIAIGAQLASALAYAHQREVIHRDVKPGNVLFTSEKRAVLSDFGVAKVITSAASNLTRHAMVIGSTRYMSPEQERAEAITDRADVYALGLLLFEMLTGLPPPPGERVLRRVEDGKEIHSSLSLYSASLSGLVRRCLLIDPAARPSALELQQVLTGATAMRLPTRGLGRRHITAAALTLLVASGGFAAWYFCPRHAIATAATVAQRKTAPGVTPATPVPSTLTSDAPAVKPVPSTGASSNPAPTMAAPEAARSVAQKALAESTPVPHMPAAVATRAGEQRKKTPKELSPSGSDKPTSTAAAPSAASNPGATPAASAAGIRSTSAAVIASLSQKAHASTDPDERIEIFTQILSLTDDATAYFSRGVDRVAKGDLAGGLADYREAIRLNPECVMCYVNSGIILAAQQDQAGALEQYNTAIRIKPVPEAYFNRALVFGVKGDWNSSASDMSDAIRLNPNWPEAYFLRGFSLFNKGDPQGSISDFTRAIALKPAYPDAYFARGNAYVSVQNCPLGLPDLQTFLSIAPAQDGRRAGVQSVIIACLRGQRLRR
jgi:Flp pilus assembly protein TadD